MDKFRILLNKAELLRPGYVASLGVSAEMVFADIIFCIKNRIGKQIPEGINDIYCMVNGTEHQIHDQKYMDFVPGYRLIHICEIEAAILDLEGNGYNIYPLLADYSGNYFGVNYESKEICGVTRSESIPVIRVSKNIESYFSTLLSIYDANGFYLDGYGYLVSDFAIEGRIGREINIGYEYWL